MDASGNVVGTLSTTAPQIGDTVVLNIDTGLQQEVQNDLQQQILADRKTPDAVDGGRLPAAPNGAAIVMNPQNGQVLALASYPTYDLNEWVGGISSANFTALQQSGAENDNAIEGQYTPGSTFKLVTATAALQDGLIAPDHALRRHRDLQDRGLPGARREQRHRLRPARRPGRQRRHLRRFGRAHRVERLVLLQPGRDVLGAAVEVRPRRRSRTRPPPTARGRSPASTSRARRRGGSTATSPGPSCTPRRPRPSPTRLVVHR